MSEDLKKKKEEQYTKYGLELTEKINFDNMPKAIQQAEQKYLDSVNKVTELKKSSQLFQEQSEKSQADFNKGSQDILEIIEMQELERMKNMVSSFLI